MIHTFSNSWCRIGYDSEHNVVLINGEPMYLEEKPIQVVGSSVKLDSPDYLRLKLGNKCNLSCGYCLQEAMDVSARPKINFANFPDMSKVKVIELWGGEPLLYWQVIKQIVAEYDKEDLKWSMVTNGTHLRVSHIREMSQTLGRWNVAMSHEGPEQVNLRGVDPLKNLLVLEALEEIKNSRVNFMFNATVSQQSYDVDKVIRHLEPYGFPVNFELITGYDDLSRSYVLQDYQKHRESVMKALNSSYSVPTCFTQFSNGVNKILENLKYFDNAANVYACGIDSPNLWSMDISGNLILCPNTDEAYATSHDQDKVIPLNLCLPEECKDCPVRRLCRSGCPLSRDTANCLVRFNHYIPVLEFALTKALNQSELLQYEYPRRIQKDTTEV